MSDSAVADSIKRSLKVIATSVVFMYLLLFSAVAWNYFAIDRIEDRQCATQKRIANDVADAERFLDMTVPERIEEYGAIGNLPEAVVRAGLDQDRETLSTLGNPC